MLFMGYEIALQKAWEELLKRNPEDRLSVKFLVDTYEADTRQKTVVSLSCNTPAKDFTAILLLHYAARKLRGLPRVSSQWRTFREVSGVEGYSEAFRKRSVEPIIRKYGKNPQGLLTALERLPAVEAKQADAAIVITAFEAVPILIEVWAGDDEFPPEANMLFDASITQIFCTEDIVVLAGFIASSV